MQWVDRDGGNDVDPMSAQRERAGSDIMLSGCLSGTIRDNNANNARAEASLSISYRLSMVYTYIV